MIYLDTNIFLLPLFGTDKASRVCLSLLQDLSEEKLSAGTSTLTWDEFLYTLQNHWGIEKALELSQNFLITPNLVFFPATEEIINKAQILVKEKGLKPRDAIHAATAIHNSIKEIASDDADFDKIKELKRIKIR